MLQIDKTNLNAENKKLPFLGALEEFAEAIANAKPLFSFVIDDSCAHSHWVATGDSRGFEKFISQILVYQDGEALGTLLTTERRHAGKNQIVFGVNSFRIQKDRGNRGTSFSKDIKVAIRTAKKSLVPRADEEMSSHIKQVISDKFHSTLSRHRNQVRWAMDAADEGMTYAVAAYNAHLEGKDTVTLPVKLKSVKDVETHYKNLETLDHIVNLDIMVRKQNGYGIGILADGKFVCYSFADDTVTRHESMDTLPECVATKLPIFKVLEKEEPYKHLGVKLEDDLFYIPEN